MSSRIPILASILAIVVAAPSAAAILVVDCAAGPFFDIDSAVLAAGSGDTVVAHICTVPPFAYPPSRRSVRTGSTSSVPTCPPARQSAASG